MMKIKVLEKYEVVNGLCNGWVDVKEEWSIEEIREFLSKDKRNNRICLDNGSTFAGKDYSLDTFNDEFPQKEKVVNIENPELKKILTKNLNSIFKYVDFEEDEEEDIPKVEIHIGHDYDGVECEWFVTCTVWVDGEFGEINGESMDYETVVCATEKECLSLMNRCINYLKKDKEISKYL
ncbi:MAG: hypothetical protein RSC84_03445 [Peptostreptococcaceae bacterium]